jgi:hypothetical protein
MIFMIYFSYKRHKDERHHGDIKADFRAKKQTRDYLDTIKSDELLSNEIYELFAVHMRAKIKAPIIMKSVLKVIFDVIAELHRSVSQQTLAIMEFAST